MTKPTRRRPAPRAGHPGKALEDLMRLHGIDRRQLHLACGMDIMRVYNLLEGTRAITADSAVRLGRFFEQDPRYWMHLQAEYELDSIDTSQIHHEIQPVSANRWQQLPRQRSRRAASRK